MTQCTDISIPMVRMNVLPPSSGLESNRSNRYEARTAACFLLVACLAYASTLKMEAIRSFEIFLNLYETTRHIPEDSAFLSLSAKSCTRWKKSQNEFACEVKVKLSLGLTT
jgi:hypothetical protein